MGLAKKPDAGAASPGRRCWLPARPPVLAAGPAAGASCQPWPKFIFFLAKGTKHSFFFAFFFDITHHFEYMEQGFEATGGWSMQGRSFLSNFHGHSS